jgi:protein TonB
MNYAEQQRNPARQIVGFIAVALFHVLLIWALVNGLGKNIVDIIKQPLETKIIKDTKPPPKEAPPPPPPQLAAPPPPYVPPPDIQIANPQPVNNAITQTTTVAPPPGPVAPTAPPAPPAPDTDVSAVPISRAPLVYPEDMQDEEREGRVSVSCDVDTSGHTDNCAVNSVSGGESFARAALTYVRGNTYVPAKHNGVPVSTRHTWVLNYKLSD